MNDYAISDLAVGMTEQFEVLLTREMMDSFLALTGDNNPLHTDERYAKAAGFKDRVAYGMLCASFYSTLAGVYLPGRRCLLHRVDSKFKRPVFAGDALTVSGTVSAISEGLNQVEIKAKIKNQDDETVGTAVISAGIL